MTLSRREAIAGAIAVPVAAGTARAFAAPQPGRLLPDKASFVPSPIAYLDNAAAHPISRSAKKAIDGHLAMRMLDPAAPPPFDRAGVIAKFAALVHADPDEITWTQSTTAGEQAVLRALGFPHKGGRVVVETLHFHLSFPMYMEMAKQGVDVAWVKQREGRIELDDMAKAITPGTRLVCLSLVSTYNGFHHDLKAICDMAHKVGSLVYADIIHAAGAIPVDLHGCGVDFAATAAYKWLMGDSGLGFLYARRGVADRLERTEYGYYGFSNPGAPAGIGLSVPETHIYPLDPPGQFPVRYDVRGGAIGHFGSGSYAGIVAAQLNHSLDYIAGIGVPAIQAHAQALLAMLRPELVKKGYKVITPADTATPLLTFLLPDAKAVLAEPLAKAKVRVNMLHDHHVRVSPSVHNDAHDIERLIAALPRVS